MSWATLLKRVFEFDLEHCPNCGGELKIIAAIVEASVIEKILTHLALKARAPPRAAARGQMPLQAEPGHKQSSGLFVPGEGPGHWPGAPCKGPEHSQVIAVGAARRPGPGDPLRPGVSGPGQAGLIAMANPWASPLMGLCGRVPPALSSPRSATKTAIRASTDGPGHSVAWKKGL